MADAVSIFGSIPGNKRAAVSLTFDDGLQCQLDYAIPAMDEHSIKGTFFLPAMCPAYPVHWPSWRAVADRGHELGGHSVNHQKARTMDGNTARSEAFDSAGIIRRSTGAEVRSYAYPYTDAPMFYQDAVQRAHYVAARGGRVARADKFIRQKDELNRFNVPCLHVNGGCFDDLQPEMWIDCALERQSWIVLMFHGVGPDATQWDNVPAPQFAGFMKFLAAASKRGLWVATFGEVAERFAKRK